uniref:MCM domain-containing protein n=1 Tax=Schistocephalus solidus TaxID=70667 RepID=A0A183TJG9_SCHSO
LFSITPSCLKQDSKPKKFFRKLPCSKKRNPPLSDHVRPENDSSIQIRAPPPSTSDAPIVLGNLPKFCPFPGWLLYFPEKAYDSVDPAVKMTEAFVSYIKQSCLSSMGPDLIDWSAIEECQTIHVDYPSLLTSALLKKRIPGWPTDSSGEFPPNAALILQSLGLAVHTVASQQMDMHSGPQKEFLHPLILQESDEGFTDENDNRTNLQHDSTGSFPTSSSSSGRVPRSIPCSLDRDLVSSCVPGDFVHIVGVVSLLPAESSGSQAGASHQPISSLESGRRCAQANFFNICLRVNNMTLIYGRSGGNAGGGDGSDSAQINDGTHRGAVQCLTARDASLGCVKGLSDIVDPSQAIISSKSDSYFTLNDLYAIRGLSESQDLFRLLISSFCPSICGRELVKMAILLTLFGASTFSPSVDLTHALDEGERSPSLSLSSDTDSCEELRSRNADDAFNDFSASVQRSFERRTSSHLLLIGTFHSGDPGIGKSQLLRAAASVAPRAVYVCGNATSAAGLTVSTGRDQSGSGFGLEAGALVLADQGCCCIDEFDKISCDPASLLEVLEQQTVSVARGGFVCNLAARTSVMAAANPVVGHYDASKSVEENVRISRSLLSRFDLIFILPDRPSERQDRRLSEHILALHTGKQRNQFAFRGTAYSANVCAVDEETNKSLETRLQLPYGFDYSRLISPILLRKYIAYARRYVHPRYVSLASFHPSC